MDYKLKIDLYKVEDKGAYLSKLIPSVISTFGEDGKIFYAINFDAGSHKVEILSATSFENLIKDLNLQGAPVQYFGDYICDDIDD